MSYSTSVAIAPERNRKSFQYAGHYRSDHRYSPFHLSLDAAFKHFYSKSNPTKMLVQSSTGNGVYQLTPTRYVCECDCGAYIALKRAYTEDCYLRGLINKHPVLKGQLPDKHVFALWKSWRAKDFRHYQHEQGKRSLLPFGLSLNFVIPGHFSVNHRKSGRLGTVDLKVNENGREFWINQRQLTILSLAPGDRIEYQTAESAAIALARLLKVIDDGEKAKADLEGGGWDEQPQHLIAPHADFIDDVNQERSPQLVSAFGQKKNQRDPFGGFNF